MRLQKRRFFYFYAGAILALAFVLIFWTPFFFLSGRRIHFSQPATIFFHYFLPLIGIQVKVQGKEHLNEIDGGIVLSNHQSQLDIALILGWIKSTSFLAKAELFNIPIFKNLLYWSGSLPVHRGSPQKNKELLYPILKATQSGKFFCVFPEGTRSLNGEILPFKTGIFHYIKEGDLTFLPIYIHNAYQIWPKGLFKLRRGLIYIQILPPLRAKDYAGIPAEGLRELVRNQLLNAQQHF